MKHRTTLAALVAAPVAALAYSYHRAQSPPEVTPERFVAARLRKPGHTVVACLGASLVRGRIGASFVDELERRLGPERFQFVNAGANGDLAYNIRQRLEPLLACDPDVVVVLVGSNDVMASLGTRRAWTYRLFKSLPVRPDIEWFGENLRSIARDLRDRTHARVAFCSLPTLGERVDASVNERLHLYNAVIRDIAAETGAAYIPLHESLDEALQRMGHARGPSFVGATRRMVLGVVQHYVLGRSWDQIAKEHGYAVFVDGIHVSEQGAVLVATEIERFLRNEKEVPRHAHA